MRVTHLLALICVILIGGCSNLPVRQQDSVFPSPVAFVTAGPLPQPSVTPTLPVIAKPTEIPPTLVPKKLPLESTATIGLWSDQITSAESFTGVVDLAVGPAGIQLQKTNLALVSLAERQVYQGYTDVISDVIANHPAWILYDKKGNVAYSSGKPNAPLLNIQNSDVKSQIAEDIAKNIHDNGYDGVVLDGVGRDLIRSDTPPVITATKTFTEQVRRDAVESLLRSIRTKIPDKLMIIGGYAWADGAAYSSRTSESQELASIGDGIHIDEFLRAPYSDTTVYKSETNWKKDVDYLAAMSQDGKIVLITTRIDATEPNSRTLKQWLDYSVASYLLGKNGSRTYFQFDNGNTLTNAGDKEFSAPIGAPVEAYTKLSSGIYRRLFNKGIVLVNPTSDQKETEFDTDYHLINSVEPLRKLTMGPHTGIILLKP